MALGYRLALLSDGSSAVIPEGRLKVQAYCHRPEGLRPAVFASHG
jgi:hypothetical protein